MGSKQSKSCSLNANMLENKLMPAQQAYTGVATGKPGPVVVLRKGPTYSGSLAQTR